jgi:hypothetical protein
VVAQGRVHKFLRFDLMRIFEREIGIADCLVFYCWRSSISRSEIKDKTVDINIDSVSFLKFEIEYFERRPS